MNEDPLNTNTKRGHSLSEPKDPVTPLQCVHQISALREKKGLAGWRDYLRGIAELLPTALRFPENACARISRKRQMLPDEAL